jgi:hypothetical protein
MGPLAFNTDITRKSVDERLGIGKNDEIEVHFVRQRR